MSAVFLFTAHTVKAEDSKDPIKMTLHDWTGQLITTNIMAEVLKKAGNNVELVQADYISSICWSTNRRPSFSNGDVGNYRS